MKINAALVMAFLLALAGSISAQTSVTLVPAGSTWRYLDNGTDPGPLWRGMGYIDTNWNSGPAQLGYGDGDEATVVNGGPSNNRYVTTFFRRTFVVPAS